MKIVNISKLCKYNIYITEIQLCNITPNLVVKNYTYRTTPVGHFVLGVKGKARYFNDSLSLDILPKTLAYIPTDYTIHFEEDKEYEYYKIYFRLWDAQSRDEIILSNAPYIFFNETPKEILNFITEFTSFYSTNNASSMLKFQSMLFSLLHMIVKITDEVHNNVGMATISNAIIFLQSNYNLHFHTKDLADMCNLSEPYFRTLFKKYMRVTPTEYKHQMRIRRACEILLGSDIPVERTAEIVGFNDVQYFCEIFKKITGCTALQYRNGTPRTEKTPTILNLSQFGIHSPVDKN